MSGHSVPANPAKSGVPTIDAERVGPEPAPEAVEVVDDLRRRLAAEREISLNAVDAVLGAQAETAQVRAENKELQYRLHVREVELGQAKDLLTIARPAEQAGGEGRDDDGAPEIATAARSLVRAARHTVRWP